VQSYGTWRQRVIVKIAFLVTPNVSGTENGHFRVSMDTLSAITLSIFAAHPTTASETYSRGSADTLSHQQSGNPFIPGRDMGKSVRHAATRAYFSHLPDTFAGPSGCLEPPCYPPPDTLLDVIRRGEHAGVVGEGLRSALPAQNRVCTPPRDPTLNRFSAPFGTLLRQYLSHTPPPHRKRILATV
jgi:hypothetical protein